MFFFDPAVELYYNLFISQIRSHRVEERNNTKYISTNLSITSPAKRLDYTKTLFFFIYNKFKNVRSSLNRI
jgi:hypothetical protein